MIGAHQGRREWLVLARPAAQTVFMLLAISFATLAWSFYVNDFSVLYVAEHSNSQLPVVYRLGAVWGGHEGSLLLWVFLLSTWTFLVAQLSKSLDEFMVARVIGVLGLVITGLLLFVLTTSSPFERLLPAAQDGRSLNPLLQDPGLVFHPPMLYMGYVGFSVAFAFAIAALIGGNLDANWARWTRPWTTVAWVFLTLGIALGLVLGKQLGIFAFSWLCIRFGWATLPDNTSYRQLYGAAVLCGIGFTMSLFIGGLAFDGLDASYETRVKLGVLAGSLLSGLVGTAILVVAARNAQFGLPEVKRGLAAAAGGLMRQRMRWARGMIEAFRHHPPQLVAHLLASRRPRRLARAWFHRAARGGCSCRVKCRSG